MTMPDTAASFALSNPDGLYDPAPNAYSHVATLRAGAELVFVAGQGGENAHGRLSADFAEQAAQAIANLQTALRSRGAELDQVFKLTLLIAEHSEEKLRSWVMQAERAWPVGLKPVCTLIPVPRLALDGMQIEIDAVAALP